MSDTTKRLEKLLSDRKAHEIFREGDFVHAAVMMILKESGQDYSLLFIKRPENDRYPFQGIWHFRAVGWRGAITANLKPLSVRLMRKWVLILTAVVEFWAVLMM